jgi:hypothetical protein
VTCFPNMLLVPAMPLEEFQFSVIERIIPFSVP